MISLKTLVLVGLGVAIWVLPGIAAPASRGGHVTADEPQYLMSAISLAEDHDLDVGDERAEGRFRVFHRADLPQQESVRADGSAVSPHDPLLPAYLALPVFLGGWIGAKVALALLAGLLAATLLWIAVVRFAVPERTAVITVLAFACAAPLAVYGTQVYPELPAALAVALAIAALTGPLERRGIALATVAVVALPWLSVKYAPVAAALALILFARLGRRAERGAAFATAGGLAVAGVIFAVAHLRWYGGLTPYASGSHFSAGELSVVGSHPNYLGRSMRLIGLLVDRDFGLAVWQPAYLLMVPALAVLLVKRPAHWAVLALPLLAGWLNATFVALTMHGWWWPGRQTVVVLPCVVLAVAWWAATRPFAVRALAVLGVVGASIFAWLVAQAVFGGLNLVVRFETITHPLVRAWRVFLPDYRDLTARDWALHSAWLTLFVLVVAAHAIASTRRARPNPFSRTRLQGATSS